MISSAEAQTVVLPRGPAPRTSSTPALPVDVVRDAARRLRSLALLYASVFLMAGFVPTLVFPADRAQVFASPIGWVPGALAIVMGLAFAGIFSTTSIAPATMMTLGLVFEIVSSYGIAAAEFLDARRIGTDLDVLGLSWVGVWVLLFTVVVPTQPRRAVLVALASVSSIPIMAAISMATVAEQTRPDAVRFFFWLTFPHLLVVVMAYVGARVVYNLGTEVTRARQLGSYHLVERLGQGGMGEVWRASHRLLARPAAIKLIRPSLTAAGDTGQQIEAARRFELEAQVIASLRSPHTVELFDFGIADDGAFYYVMELLDGFDADTLVRRTGPMPPERVIHVLRQVCHSLSEAESRGLVHRDIKPANIILCRYGEDYDFVKVVDFGIVKTSTETRETAPAITMGNAIHGTPAFIAPEQAMDGQVDSRADIYATGCVAYWLLTGQLVFEADTPLALALHHANTVPVAPSTRCETPIPPALDALVLSCLAKDPAARPQSLRELVGRLREIDCGQAWTESRARDWWAVHQLHQPGAGDRAASH